LVFFLLAPKDFTPILDLKYLTPEAYQFKLMFSLPIIDATVMHVGVPVSIIQGDLAIFWGTHVVNAV
jgi:hypothetical protein